MEPEKTGITRKRSWCSRFKNYNIIPKNIFSSVRQVTIYQLFRNRKLHFIFWKILLIKNSFYLGQNSSRFMASKRLVCIFVHWGYLSSPLYMLADLASLIQSSLEDFPSLRLLHWSWFLPNHCTFECWLNWKIYLSLTDSNWMLMH